MSDRRRCPPDQPPRLSLVAPPRERQEQLDGLIAWADEQSLGSASVVIAGDMNASPCGRSTANSLTVGKVSQSAAQSAALVGKATASPGGGVESRALPPPWLDPRLGLAPDVGDALRRVRPVRSRPVG